MFVHLDIGWMSHPFPLSSFRITSPAQLATIRSLGLRTVRWSPQQSDPVTDPTTTLPGPLPARAGDAANDSGLGDVDAVDAVPYVLPADDNVVDAASHARQRAQAERRRSSPSSAPPSSAARASTSRRRAPASKRSSWCRASRSRRARRPRRCRARSSTR
jgi:hypothetical protein